MGSALRLWARSPNGALLLGVVLLAGLAVERLAECLRVGRGSDDAELAERMDAADDGSSQILVSVLAAPDLAVVDEEELLGREVESGQSGLGSVLFQPSLVSLLAKTRSLALLLRICRTARKLP